MKTKQHFKYKFYKILHVLNQDKSEWLKHVDNILKQNNNTVHSTIEISPNDALRPANALWVSWHLWNSAKRDRTYPEIKEGDMARANISKRKLVNHICQIGVPQNIN